MCNSKAIKISPNQHAGLHRSLYYNGFFENSKKGGKVVSRHKLAKLFQIVTSLCLVPQLFSKMCFVFHVWEFDDVMISEKIKFYFIKFY